MALGEPVQLEVALDVRVARAVPVLVEDGVVNTVADAMALEVAMNE